MSDITNEICTLLRVARFFCRDVGRPIIVKDKVESKSFQVVSDSM